MQKLNAYFSKMSYSDIGGKMKIALKSMVVIVFIAAMLFLNVGTYAKNGYISKQSRVAEAKGKEMKRIESISKTLHGKETKIDDMGLAWSSDKNVSRVDLAYNGKIISHFSPKFSYVYNEDLANWFKDFEGQEVTLILYADQEAKRELLRVNYKIVPMVEPKPEETVEPKPEKKIESSKPDETIKAIEETVEPCPLGNGDDHSPSMQD